MFAPRIDTGTRFARLPGMDSSCLSWHKVQGAGTFTRLLPPPLPMFVLGKLLAPCKQSKQSKDKGFQFSKFKLAVKSLVA